MTEQERLNEISNITEEVAASLEGWCKEINDGRTYRVCKDDEQKMAPVTVNWADLFYELGRIQGLCESQGSDEAGEEGE